MSEDIHNLPEQNVLFESLKKYIDTLPLFHRKLDQLLSKTIIWKINSTLERASEKSRLIDLLKQSETSQLQVAFIKRLPDIEQTLFSHIQQLSKKTTNTTTISTFDLDTNYQLEMTVKKQSTNYVYELSLQAKNDQQQTYQQSISENKRLMPAGEVVFRQVKAWCSESDIKFLSEIFSRPSEGSEWQGMATLFMRLTHRLNRTVLDAIKQDNQVAFASMYDATENGWTKRRALEIGFTPGAKQKIRTRLGTHYDVKATTPNSDLESSFTYFYH